MKDKSPKQAKPKVLHKTEGTRIIVQVSEHEGAKYLQVAKQYKRKKDTDWNYTRNVVNIPLEKKALKGLRKVLKEALAELE